MKRLDEASIKDRLGRVGGWRRSGDEIVREFEFPGFPAAIEFVRRVADLAEEADHHPDIDIRFNRVRLAVSTHSAGGLTERDFDLAERIDAEHETTRET